MSVAAGGSTGGRSATTVAVAVSDETAKLGLGVVSPTRDSAAFVVCLVASSCAVGVRVVRGRATLVASTECWSRLAADRDALDRLVVRVGLEAGSVSSSTPDPPESVEESGVSCSDGFSSPGVVELVSDEADGEFDVEPLVEPEVAVDEPSDVEVDAAPPVDPLDDAPAPDVEGSADATPCPVNTAVPIPRATASPPIRPTYDPAPMPI
ncbi:MAG: hypothetical protein QOF25_1689 [Mycobacterium sp.]|nr:hypothetical protein [Mycobacterium sp.]